MFSSHILNPISQEPDTLHVLSHSFFSVWNLQLTILWRQTDIADHIRWVWKSINQTIDSLSSLQKVLSVGALTTMTRKGERAIWESVFVCCSKRAIRSSDLKRRCSKRAIRSLRSVVVTVAVHLRSHSQPSPDAASPIWSYPVSDLKVGIFPPFLVSYSITVSRVLKITLECRFIDDFSQTEIDLVLKTRNIYVLLVLMKFYILKF